MGTSESFIFNLIKGENWGRFAQFKNNLSINLMILAIFIIISLILILAEFFLQSFLIHFSTKKFKINNTQYKTAIKITIYFILLTFAIGIIPAIFLNSTGLPLISKILLGIIGFFVLHELLKKYYKTTLKQNIKIYTLYAILSIILSISVSLFVIIPIRYFIVQPFYAKGAAMEPTLVDNEYMFIDQISYRFNKPERGDVIVFRYPENPQEYFIKRIIALPGESVQIKNEKVYIFNNNNPEGMELTETYLATDTKTYSSNNEIIKIKDDEYFVLGDNRTASKDSRTFGPLNKNFIIGKHWVSPLKNK